MDFWGSDKEAKSPAVCGAFLWRALMQDIIITDLTRFRNAGLVCTAGIDLQTGQCIRPMPYIDDATRARLNLQPGSILRGVFRPTATVDAPHNEDHNHTNTNYIGQCSDLDFRRALELSLEECVSSGFNFDLSAGGKVVPIEHRNAIPQSIITIQIEPRNFEIVEDQYNPGKIKAHFRDSSGTRFRFISITDLGFFDYAREHHDEGDLWSLNNFIHRQTELFLRVGLSRAYQSGERNGYWLQVNGIYTFPVFMRELRGNI